MGCWRSLATDLLNRNRRSNTDACLMLHSQGRVWNPPHNPYSRLGGRWMRFLVCICPVIWNAQLEQGTQIPTRMGRMGPHLSSDSKGDMLVDD